MFIWEDRSLVICFKQQRIKTIGFVLTQGDGNFLSTNGCTPKKKVLLLQEFLLTALSLPPHCAWVAVCIDRILCLSSLSLCQILLWSKANSFGKPSLIHHSHQKDKTFFFPELIGCSLSTTPSPQTFFIAVEWCLYQSYSAALFLPLTP